MSTRQRVASAGTITAIVIELLLWPKAGEPGADRSARDEPSPQHEQRAAPPLHGRVLGAVARDRPLGHQVRAPPLVLVSREIVEPETLALPRGAQRARDRRQGAEGDEKRERQRAARPPVLRPPLRPPARRRPPSWKAKSGFKCAVSACSCYLCYGCAPAAGGRRGDAVARGGACGDIAGAELRASGSSS